MREPPITIILLTWRKEPLDAQVLETFFEDLNNEEFGVLPLDLGWREYDRSVWVGYFRSLNIPWAEYLYDHLAKVKGRWWIDLRWIEPVWILLQRIAEANALRAVILVALVNDEDERFEKDLYSLWRHMNLSIVNLGERRAFDFTAEQIPVSFFEYPAKRDELFWSLKRFHEDSVSLERRSRLETMERGNLFDLNYESLAAAPRHVTQKKFDEVRLGASAPSSVAPGESFVARFAAYTKQSRSEVRRILEREAPSSELRLDLDKCRWRRGTRVTVRLEATDATVSNSTQRFKWEGNWQVLRFDVKVNDKVVSDRIILKFDVAVEGFPIVSLRPEITVRAQTDLSAPAESMVVDRSAPRTAFASYAQKDRREVLGRVRSLQIFTGIDVFMDCLSLTPGDEWKRKLRKEINERDIFWLFWSREAMNSKWVDWEWRTALVSKALVGIQPHPLEPSDLAPPPKELASLEFGLMYEWYLSQLRPSWLSSHFRVLSGRAGSWARGLGNLLGSETPLITRILTFTAIIIVLAAISVVISWIIP